jgi:hypothetical protein
VGKEEYNHKEAFCLMTYRCQDCGHEERIWNSRDGVTPFGMTCLKCHGHNMLHVDWHRDECNPHHIPEPGQGVWIDIPPNLRAPAARARIASFDGTEYELDFGSERWTTVFDSLVDDTFRPEAPWLIRWPGHKGEG